MLIVNESIGVRASLSFLHNSEALRVDISHETPAETDRRLGAVIRQARLAVYPGAYAFLESPVSTPLIIHGEALALVRDDAVWSQLIPCDGPRSDLFAIFRFHFPAGIDNSGFVGWLASTLKQRFGTGVFVTCGQNSGDGGIFDYWGVPYSLGAAVIAEVEAMVGGQTVTS